MKISIITPSYNQSHFIERTIDTVRQQTGDFAVEHIIIDGGSTDGTLDILERLDSSVVWTSEPDEGQSDAINKGFAMASGEILAWLNSDDEYLPGALARVAEEYRKDPFKWCFGNCRNIDEESREIRPQITRYKNWQSRHYSYGRLLRRLFIPQPATFFTRKAYEDIGGLSHDLHYAMDYDYWLRLGCKYDPRYIDAYLACFRWHDASKNGALYRKAAWEALQTARRHAPPGSGYDLFWHYVHFVTLVCMYPFL